MLVSLSISRKDRTNWHIKWLRSVWCLSRTQLLCIYFCCVYILIKYDSILICIFMLPFFKLINKLMMLVLQLLLNLFITLFCNSFVINQWYYDKVKNRKKTKAFWFWAKLTQFSFWVQSQSLQTAYMPWNKRIYIL